MNNLEYLKNEYKYLKETAKGNYVKVCYEDLIKAFKFDENTDNVHASYLIATVFKCINESINKNSFDKLIENSSELLSTFVDERIDDKEQIDINKQVIEIIALFYNITKEKDFKYFEVDLNKFIENFYRIMIFKPISPLMGTEDEWIPDDKSEPTIYINKRYSSVSATSNKGDNAKNSMTKIYSRDNGNTWYTEGTEDITFPYEVPLYPEKIYLENYVKDTRGPSIIVDSLLNKANVNNKFKGFAKYSEICLGFLPSTSEGNYTNNDEFKAKYSIILKTYVPENDNFELTDFCIIDESVTRNEAVIYFNKVLKDVLKDITVYDNVDLKELI